MSPSPANAVRLEMLRALGGAALLVPRSLVFLARRRTLAAELRADLERAAPPDPAPPAPARLGGAIPRDRPLVVFIACAEVSGQIHASNAVAALRARLAEAGAPAPRLVGFGGARLAEHGVDLIGRPVERAQMGLQGVASSLPYYAALLRDAATFFRDARPDALFAVDSPALHVPLMRIAKRYGVRTVHFVTPQYWGWAPWRTTAYRSVVDRALSILPFEPAWFARRGVRVAHVGHPLLDELERLHVAAPPALTKTATASARDLVLLPGSRAGVIERNLPWMLRAAVRLRATAGDVPVVVAHDRPEMPARSGEIRAHIERAGAAGFARVAIGDLHGTLARARAALSVSGTVLLDLLHERLPAVVIYRLAHAHEAWLQAHVLTVPWFSSVNLLAGSEVYPEFCFAGEGPADRVHEALARCYNDEAWRARCRSGLELARERLGPPGACDRAAGHLIDVASARREGST
jgi:lipid-A-disaccharide synthase